MGGTTNTITQGARPKTTIVSVAEKEFTPRNQVNCSGYVKDVAHALGVWLPDVDANELIDEMENSPSWTQLGHDDVTASKMAAQHYFVVAGWKNPNGHGHLVVIVPGRENGYAKGFWGSLHHASKAGENQGIDYAFDPAERSQVQYFATPVSALAASP